jgi:hypothetical protein
MLLQGDLQAVFDALYTIGAIDPVLKMDWNDVNQRMTKSPAKLDQAVRILNACSGDRDELIKSLNSLDSESVQFIALEVAREFSEFQDRQSLH